MAKVTSRKHNAMTVRQPRVEIADSALSLARSNMGPNNSPSAYHIRFTPMDGEDREYSVTFSPEEWARLVGAWKQ